MLSVARTDRMRVVVQVDDKSAPYIFTNSPAVVTLDSLPGEIFKAHVSRTADIIGGGSEDGSQTQIQNRTMRTEVDLENPEGRIKGGMYGWVTLELKIPPAAAQSVSLPSTCLTGTYEDGCRTRLLSSERATLSESGCGSSTKLESTSWCRGLPAMTR